MAKRKGEKSWKKSAAAHIRLQRFWNTHGNDNVTDNTKYNYHGRAAHEIEKFGSCLSKEEKKAIYKEARNEALHHLHSAYGYGGESFSDFLKRTHNGKDPKAPIK